jgi:hypothetical protein
MPRVPSTFRQRDLCAAIKAVLLAGREVARVEVGKDGRIIVIVATTCKEQQPVDEADRANEWDDLK